MALVRARGAEGEGAALELEDSRQDPEDPDDA